MPAMQGDQQYDSSRREINNTRLSVLNNKRFDALIPARLWTVCSPTPHHRRRPVFFP